ncbi:unnamed protein product [Auanema sp. JU1783]|nr:unnamed protein product [Auanema sp. JU1783]
MALTDPLATSYHLQTFDKGLRSRALGDQLSTVVNTSVLLDDNPFPLFVNQIVVKLADAFRDGSNELRLCVARVLSECHSHLSLVFSRAEILKKILTVSHSNDPEARALTLQILASLAPVFPDNKQVHHLIMESLSTENDLEFKSACHAMAEITKLSADFADTVIPLLSTLLQSSEASIERKSLLIPVFGGMKAMVSTTEKIFLLAHSILETYTHMPLICSLLETMTKLAEATRYAIPDQLNILLSALNRAEDNVALALSALNGLQILAKYSHVWNEEHLKIILDIEPKLEQRRLIFNKFLNLLITLSQHARPNQLSFFEQVLTLLITSCTSPDYEQRVSYLQIACNVFRSQPNDVFAQRLVNFFITSIDLSFPNNLLRKFYRALGDFFCCGHLSDSNISDLLTPLVHLDRKKHEHKMQELINLFCRLTDHLPIVVTTIHEWARGTVQILDDLSRTSIAFLLLAPGVHVPDSKLNVIQGNDWERYRVAKIAFRNGHWREAALINLKHIDISKLSYQSSRWICFLQELSAAQVSEVTVQAYEQQKNHLTNALSIVDVLLTGVQDGSEFRFPRGFTNCMILSNQAVFYILSGFSTFQKLPEQYKMPGASARLKALILHAINSLEFVTTSWNILIRSSYGADYQTHDYISILQCMYTIINYGLLCIINRSSARTPVLPNLRVETTSLKKSLSLLNWANEQMTLIDGKDISEKNVHHFLHVLSKLCSQRIQIPRYFFHQGESTNAIQLAVITGQNGEVSVMPGQLYPIQVDGVISSNQTRPVHSITVKAHIQYYIGQSNNAFYSQVVKPKEGLYFQAQFLLSFKQSCQIDFTVEFTDSKTLQTWYSDTKASLRVQINE